MENFVYCKRCNRYAVIGGKETLACQACGRDDVLKSLSKDDFTHENFLDAGFTKSNSLIDLFEIYRIYDIDWSNDLSDLDDRLVVIEQNGVYYHRLSFTEARNKMNAFLKEVLGLDTGMNEDPDLILDDYFYDLEEVCDLMEEFDPKLKEETDIAYIEDSLDTVIENALDFVTYLLERAIKFNPGIKETCTSLQDLLNNRGKEKKILFHGSTCFFDNFNVEKANSNAGSDFGRGTYFSTHFSEAYAYTRPKENKAFIYLIEVPFNLFKRELHHDKLTITQDEFSNLFKDVIMQEDPVDVLSNYGSVEDEGYDSVFDYAVELEYSTSENDVDLYNGLISSLGSVKMVAKAFIDHGFTHTISGSEYVLLDPVYMDIEPKQVVFIDEKTHRALDDVKEMIFQGYSSEYDINKC